MITLFFDLETGPIKGYSWSVYDTNIIDIIEDSALIGFSYKINDGDIISLSRREFSERQLVKFLWKLFNEADVLVAQNGDRFDIRMANRFFIKYGLKPPAPYKTVDTLKLARKYFRFTSNKLDFLAETLLGERKIKTDLDLWMRCLKGDTEALLLMEKYCEHDVRLLYGVYEKLKSWHTGHPNHNLYAGTTHNCPVCGGSTQKRGFMYTRAGKYQRHQCTKCGAWSKGIKVNEDKVIQ